MIFPSSSSSYVHLTKLMYFFFFFLPNLSHLWLSSPTQGWQLSVCLEFWLVQQDIFEAILFSRWSMKEGNLKEGISKQPKQCLKVLWSWDGGQAGSLQLCCGIVPPSLASETFSTIEEKAWGGRERHQQGKGVLSGWILFNWNPRRNYFP